MSAMASGMRPVVIMLHGSGDTGRGVEQWVRSLAPQSELDKYEWLFPSAEVIPYSLAGGQPSSVWYDRRGGFQPYHPEITPTVERSAQRILGLIDDAVAKGVPPGKIAVGGFSMGGNLAYQTAARYHSDAAKPALGAVFGLSCYMADDSRAYALAQESGARWPATYVAHGSADDFILPQWGEGTFTKLKASGVDASFRLIPGICHEMAPGEIADVLAFLGARLGGEPSL